MILSLLQNLTGLASKLILTSQANNIGDYMKNILKFMTQNFKLTNKIIAKQTYCKNSHISYKVSHIVQMSKINIATQ